MHTGEEGWSGKTGRLIGFEILTAGTGPERRGAAKVSGALPDNYRLPKNDLAWLMNEWRGRALAQPVQPSGVPRIRRESDTAG